MQYGTMLDSFGHCIIHKSYSDLENGIESLRDVQVWTFLKLERQPDLQMYLHTAVQPTNKITERISRDFFLLFKMVNIDFDTG